MMETTRTIVTIMIVATLCFIAIRSNVVVSSTEFVTIAAMIVAFWFGQRNKESV